MGSLPSCFRNSLIVSEIWLAFTLISEQKFRCRSRTEETTLQSLHDKQPYPEALLKQAWVSLCIALELYGLCDFFKL